MRLVVYACVALFVGSLWTATHRTITAQSHRLMYKTPKRPYAYRVLVPSVVKSAVSVVPKLKRWSIVKDWQEQSPRFAAFLEYYKCTPSFFPELFLVLLAMLLSLFGFAVVLRKWFADMYEPDGFAAELGPVLGLLMVLVMYQKAFYIYDLPQLFLFTCALRTLCTCQWRWFYPIVVVAFFNKETTALITLVSAVYLWRRIPARSYWIHLGSQIVIFTGLWIFVRSTFDPGTPMTPGNNPIRNYLDLNLFRFWRWMLLPDFTFFATITILALPIVRHLARAPVFLRRSMVLFVAFLAAQFKGGAWGELRVLAEVYPIGFLLFYGGILELVARPPAVTPDQINRDRFLPLGPRAVRAGWLVAMLLVGFFFAAAAITAVSTGMDRLSQAP